MRLLILPKFLIFLLVQVISIAIADPGPDNNIIFNDSYIGYLEQRNGKYFLDGRVVESYSEPQISKKTDDWVNFIPVSMNHGGSILGVLYKAKKTDEQGNNFYLINSAEGKEAWIKQISETDENKLDLDDSSVGERGSMVLSEFSDKLDTEKLDGVPDVQNEYEKLFKQFFEEFTPDYGLITIEFSDHYENFNSGYKIFPSAGNANEIILTRDELISLAHHSGRNNASSDSAKLVFTLLKMEGSRALLKVDSPVNNLSSRYVPCDGYGEISFFWLETSGLKIKINSESKFPAYRNNSLYLDSVQHVDAVHIFNGKKYVLIGDEVRFIDPFHFDAPDQGDSTGNLGVRVLSLSHKWEKHRDQKGRLRFMFNGSYDGACAD